ncbi:YicC/YloC family endoribonuclease [Aurantimonas sp. Leaf443]|uniref:YicC/YloC family endoribonuclease n=1 Tax=Aurantimonas sp. Leaf443 TaxID=1736378 RepID=UPI0006FC993E|nr:YicC/YloC family endoribonuclease [Aurantimonas sp. Leaf443]KQT88397.1 hypothetical protein ASG48_02960 [Aurantimonas sp. Leaf443]
MSGIASMTGFARQDGTTPDGLEFTWELRSVNGKGLDLRLRLPAGTEAIEIDLRKRASAALARGNVQAALQLRRAEIAPTIRVNEAALAQLLELSARLVKDGHARAPTVDGLLSLRGVLDAGEGPDEAAELRQARHAVLTAGFQAALDALVAARRSEGAALLAILRERLAEIARLVSAVERDPSRTVEALRARLSGQLRDLLGQDDRLDPARLHQEVALVATRADIREEIDRLKAHVDQADALLTGGGPVGRRLDFLAQELNRESNTICSKSAAASLTALGLELKVVVDQFREQVQNIE